MISAKVSGVPGLYLYNRQHLACCQPGVTRLSYALSASSGPRGVMSKFYVHGHADTFALIGVGDQVGNILIHRNSFRSAVEPNGAVGGSQGVLGGGSGFGWSGLLQAAFAREPGRCAPKCRAARSLRPPSPNWQPRWLGRARGKKQEKKRTANRRKRRKEDEK